MILFIVLTIINIPIFHLYATNTRHNDYSNLSKGFFKYFTIGNLGQHIDACGWSQVQLREGSDHLNDKKQDFYISCPSGYYMETIMHVGLLYKYNLKLGKLASGQERCESINNPTKSFDHRPDAKDMKQSKISQRHLQQQYLDFVSTYETK